MQRFYNVKDQMLHYQYKASNGNVAVKDNQYVMFFLFARIKV